MTNEVAKKQMCIIMQGNLEFWIDEDRAQPLLKALQEQTIQPFFYYEGRMLNKASVIAVVTALDAEERNRRKNGQWQCTHGFWHEKFFKHDDEECKINKILQAPYDDSRHNDSDDGRTDGTTV